MQMLSAVSAEKIRSTRYSTSTSKPTKHELSLDLSKLRINKKNQ